jgi:hypothetical protein
MVMLPGKQYCSACPGWTDRFAVRFNVLLIVQGLLDLGLSTAGRRLACHDRDAVRRWATRTAMAFAPAHAGFRIRKARDNQCCCASGVGCTSPLGRRRCAACAFLSMGPWNAAIAVFLESERGHLQSPSSTPLHTRFELSSFACRHYAKLRFQQFHSSPCPNSWAPPLGRVL